VDSDANSTGLKARLDLSIGASSEGFIHIEDHSGQRRWPDDAFFRIDMCGGFGSLDGDANFTRLKAA
jgi:hypothetical protein